MQTSVFIGRQPILNFEGQCVAYEFLYRCKGTTEAIIVDDTEATTRVIINLVHNIGISSLLEDKIGYINVDDHILLSDTLLTIPKDKFIFEILEHTKMSVAIVERVRQLHNIGYKFALDDFSPDNDNIEYYKALFPFVDILKIDLLAIDITQIDYIVKKFEPYNITLLAEKVEDIEVYKICKKAGFQLFQGYFFEKPTVIEGKKIEPSVINAMDLINTLNSTTDMNAVAQKFSQYPDLTFNLLHYMNSSHFNFNNEITSIKQILSLLGPSRLRSWLGLFLYGASQDGLFRDIIIEAATFRAKMMTELIMANGKPELADEAFLTGSLSLIDTYLQIDMNIIIEKIHLSQSMKDALLLREGYLGVMLSITEKLEKTDNIQNVIENLAPKIKISSPQLYKMYCKSNDIVCLLDTI